jgi:hypothetical protein
VTSFETLTSCRSVVIDELEARFQDEDVGLAYFYFEYVRQDQQTARHVAACLLRQLASSVKELPSQLLSLYQSHSLKGRSLDSNQLVAKLDRRVEITVFEFNHF